ncbi:methyltransferase, FkbM family [Algoriphagus boritolerans DSM 17298 = JCM 18970]|uniref:Methyltransferase, FkbM family n=1 Tax=Algoriphagus boritolerans DSM 17298 = JCM 18970 TaxID=1120964 RepID=A0A1H5YHA0_9BACT|nr:methyltransferase, FkbM family [Algoriphagus boritolerans DSM 17298 = JCM 18970]
MSTPNLSLKRRIQNQWKKYRFHLSATQSPLFLGFYRYLYSPKKGSLSEFLSTYSLSKKGDFTVIQIGANDGISNDPIHKFIKRDNWKGVLLEPQNFVFTEFTQKIYSKNTGITVLNAAIGPEDGTLPMYKIGFSSTRWATGLSSFSKEQVLKAFDNGIVAYNCKKYGETIPQDKSKWISQEEVRVISPESLIREFGIKNIDLLQIDAEGFDLEVIRIFDLKKHQPKVVVFENAGLSEEDYHLALTILKEEGYVTRRFGDNNLAMKQPVNEFEKFFQ